MNKKMQNFQIITNIPHQVALQTLNQQTEGFTHCYLFLLALPIYYVAVTQISEFAFMEKKNLGNSCELFETEQWIFNDAGHVSSP